MSSPEPRTIEEMVAELRRLGGDTPSIEAKSGARGFPTSAMESLSALANLPSGGTLIIGLDEAGGFLPVPIPATQYMQTLGNKARGFTPPVQLNIEQVTVEGVDIVVAHVRECEQDAKPCRITATGETYVRSFDGDFRMSPEEQQAFLVQRTPPRADQEPIPGTGAADLDEELLTRWRISVRARDKKGLGRFDDAEMLRKAGVVLADGTLSKAGLLALGAYPQQYLPRWVVNVADLRGAPASERAKNGQTFTGSIPVILSQTLEWLSVNLGTRAVQAPNGALLDRPEYPLAALRELVANALVHRDLSAWSAGRAVELRLKPDRFEITSPGGLYGVTVDRLGAVPFTSARNQLLLNLCVNASDAAGARVVESLATGLTTVARELNADRLPPARFFDIGLAFTVVLAAARQVPAASAHGPKTTRSSLPKIGTNLRIVYDALAAESGQTVAEIASRTKMPSESVRTALKALRGRTWNLAETVSGGRGQDTRYAAR